MQFKYVRVQNLTHRAKKRLLQVIPKENERQRGKNVAKSSGGLDPLVQRKLG